MSTNYDINICLNYPESHAILIGWVRYCLPRHSYAVSECADILVSRWHQIHKNTRTIIIRDIREHLEQVDRQLEIQDRNLDATEAIDYTCWNRTLTKIIEIESSLLVTHQM